MSLRYRLIYFNVTGLAEPIRYLLSYGKIPFADVRLDYEEWKKVKSSMPFEQIPVLEIDGKVCHQTPAICRYLARQMNLAGRNDWDAFRIDMIVDTITDFRLNYAAYFKQLTEVDKEEKLKEIKETHNPFYLKKFEKIVTENGGNFVNNQLSWADIYFSALSDLWIKLINEPILADYPSLASLKEKVDNEPNIKAYRERRPDTIY